MIENRPKVSWRALASARDSLVGNWEMAAMIGESSSHTVSVYPAQRRQAPPRTPRTRTCSGKSSDSGAMPFPLRRRRPARQPPHYADGAACAAARFFSYASYCARYVDIQQFAHEGGFKLHELQEMRRGVPHPPSATRPCNSGGRPRSWRRRWRGARRRSAWRAIGRPGRPPGCPASRPAS